MEDILNVVAKDIQKDFYDPALKGLDWKVLTAQAHEQIRKANHVGEMITAIFALVNSLEDSHTVFIPPGRTQKVSYGFNAKAFGEDILVYEVEKNGPAAAAGLEVGDNIVAVNDFRAERKTWPTMRRYFEVLNPYEYMELAVLRGGSDALKRIRIRAKTSARWALVEFNTWTYNEARQHADAEEPYYTYREYDDGLKYLKLRTFTIYPDEAGTAAKKLQRARAAVLDLRGNHGGAADATVHFAGYLTPEAASMGTMVFRNKAETIKIKPYRAEIPAALVVLIDSESASAAELVARHLQLNRRAVILGDKSAGLVNTAQVRWESVGAHDRVGFGAQVTVARVVLPNGEELENRGVTPDVFCIPTSDDLRQKKDPCLDKARTLALEMAGSGGSVAANSAQPN